MVKGQGFLAHGETFEKARTALLRKIVNALSIEERMDEFCKTYNGVDKYPAKEFYKWHNLLTGSCEMGRNEFVRKHNISLDAEYTVLEFVKLCENDYGGAIIKRLKERYKNEKLYN